MNTDATKDRDDAASLPAREARRRIVIKPEDVDQPDRRPWRKSSFHAAIAPFLLISAVLVAVTVLAVIILLRMQIAHPSAMNGR